MSTAALLSVIRSRKAVIGIVGQGYVGLPLALVFNESGFPVIGLDLDSKKVEALNRGESYIKHIGAERVANAVKTNTVHLGSSVVSSGCPPGGTPMARTVAELPPGHQPGRLGEGVSPRPD